MAKTKRKLTMSEKANAALEKSYQRLKTTGEFRVEESSYGNHITLWLAVYRNGQFWGGITFFTIEEVQQVIDLLTRATANLESK